MSKKIYQTVYSNVVAYVKDREPGYCLLPVCGEKKWYYKSGIQNHGADYKNPQCLTGKMKRPADNERYEKCNGDCYYADYGEINEVQTQSCMNHCQQYKSRQRDVKNDLEHYVGTCCIENPYLLEKKTEKEGEYDGDCFRRDLTQYR